MKTYRKKRRNVKPLYIGNKMAGLIITSKGSFKIPECEKCGSRMIPKNMKPEDCIWKCPHCMNEQEQK